MRQRAPVRRSRRHRPEKRRRRQLRRRQCPKSANGIRKTPRSAPPALPLRPSTRNHRRVPAPPSMSGTFRQPSTPQPPSRPPRPQRSGVAKRARSTRLRPWSGRANRAARQRLRLNRSGRATALPAPSRPGESRRSDRRNAALRQPLKQPSSLRGPARRPSNGSTRRPRAERCSIAITSPASCGRGFLRYACCCIRIARRLRMVGAFGAFSGS